MRIEELKIYTFGELSEKAKQKAVNNYRSKNDYYIESQLITENMEETILEKTCNTIQDLKLGWSLCCCQGDGVSFTGIIYGYDDNFIKFLETVYNGELPKNIKRIAKALLVRFKRTSHFYAHKKTCNTEVELTGNCLGRIDRIEKTLEELEKTLEEWRVNLCEYLEKQGYNDLYYYNSDEYIADIMLNNDYEFLEDGTNY